MGRGQRGGLGSMDGGEGLTKKRMIHVSRTVKPAGRMENHDIEGGGDEVRRKVVGRCSGDVAESIAWFSSKFWEV